MRSCGEWRKLQITVEGVDEVLRSPEWMCIIDKDPNDPDPWELAVFSGWTEIDSL